MQDAPLQTPEAADATLKSVGGDVASISRMPKRDQPDPDWDEISKIYVQTERFMIYSRKNGAKGQAEDRVDFGGLRLRFNGVDPEEALKLRQSLHPTMRPIARIMVVLCGMRPSPIPLLKFVNDQREKSWNSLTERCYAFMANAMQMALEGNAQKAKEMILIFREEIEMRRDSGNKMRYIFANAATLSLIAFAWVLVAFIERDQSVIALLYTGDTLTEGPIPLKYRDVLMFGAIGAFFPSPSA
jgi:hypothetical protein